LGFALTEAIALFAFLILSVFQRRKKQAPFCFWVADYRWRNWK